MANVGSSDRLVRAILGLVLIAAPFLPFTAMLFAGWGAWSYLVAAVGLVLVGTSAMRFCPLYAIFGANTCPAARR
ncbi:MAG: DUF2892 domain-containing protein [Rhizobiaceae bacterium]